MKSGLSLQGIFFQHNNEKDNPNRQSQAVKAYLHGLGPDLSLLEEIKEISAINPSSPLILAEKWQQLLLFNILFEGIELHPEDKQLLQEGAAQLSLLPTWDEFQLLSALKNLNRRLAGLSITPANIFQLESGAVPLEHGGHWQWAEVPHPLFHAELGVFWCLLGKILNDNNYLEAAAKLANWHLNTLSHDFHPFDALFIQEKDASLPALLMWNYLLFHSTALLANQPHLETPAHKQLEYLKETLQRSKWAIPEIGPVLENWLEKSVVAITPPKLCLSSYIFDPHTNLVGCRSPNVDVICSLYGGRTGMGSIKSHDVQVVNYGPQGLPLGDCLSFGIEGGSFSQKSFPPSISPEDGSFQLKRRARLASTPGNNDSNGQFRSGAHSEMWVAAQQNFLNEKLTIETSFCGYKPCDTLAFTFFVRAKSCKLWNDKVLTPRTFDRYAGPAGLVTLQGTKTNLLLEALQPTGNMQIIPLAGGDNFWGADFLVAFELLSTSRDYSWTIKSV